MAGNVSTPTISLRERSLRASGTEEKLSKWVGFSLFLHAGLISILFVMPFLASRKAPTYPIYTVDLVGGEKIGGTNFGTVLPAHGPKVTPRKPKPEAVPVKEAKAEPKKEKIEKKVTLEKKKVARALPEDKLAMKELADKDKNEKKEKTKKEEPKKTARAEVASEAVPKESPSDRVRDRLIQSAVERAKNRTESSQKTTGGEVISSGPGEGEGAAALGPGGRGGGVVKGMDFVVYQNRMLSTIKDNWVWAGQRSNLRVVVHFNIKDNGEIVGLRIVQPSGDPSYDESVIRAVKKSSPLPAPPEAVRQDFAEVELSFRPKDLGA
jgi:TolA protein